MAKPGKKSVQQSNVVQLVQSVLSNPEGEIQLTSEETKSILLHTKKLSNTCVLNLLAVEMGKGFEALQCKDMKELITKKMGLKYSTIHHRLHAARIAFSIGGIQLVGLYSDDAMRAMKNLQPGQRREVYSHIKAEQGNKAPEEVKVTVKLVKEAIKKIYQLESDGSDKPKVKQVTDKQISKFFGALLSDTENAVPNFAKSIKANFTSTQRKELIKLLEDLDEPELDLEGA